MNIRILLSLIFTIFMMFPFLILYATAKSEDEIIQLEEIRVTPGRFTISDNVLLPNSLSKAEIDKFPLIDNDIYRAAHVFPGVVANDFSARFAVRGGEKDETIVRLDGMELYEPYHLQDFGGAVSTIDLGIVQRADLLMGGFPAEYGDRMSGVFDVFAREGSRKEFRGNLGIDLVNTHLLLEGPFPKGSWLLTARRGYIDLLMSLIESEEKFEPRYADLYTKVTHDLTSKDKISIDILYALDSNKIDKKGEEDDLKSEYSNGILWGRWRHLFGEKAFSDLYIFAGKAGQEKRDGPALERSEGIYGIDDRDFTYLGGKGELNYKPLPSHTVKAGVKWQWATADYRYKEKKGGEEEIDVDVSPSGWDARGYLQDEWQIASLRFGRNLTLPLAANFGLRYIYQHYNQRFEFSPRAAVALRLKENFLIRGAWGLYHQPVGILSLPVEDGITEFEKSEEATHYILGCELSPKQNLLIKAEAYYKTLDNLIGQIRDYGRKNQIITNPESGTAKGFELFVNQFIPPRVYWSAGYAYSIAKEKVGGREFFRDFDQRHSLALNVGYAFSDNLNVHLSWRFHSGNPYTKVFASRSGSRSNRAKPDAFGLWQYEKISLPDGEVWQKELGPTNAERLPAYHSLDLRLARTHTFKYWKLHWYFQVMNLYNRQNVHEYSFTKITDDFGRILGYERNEEHLLPILPVLGVSAEF